ncbi:MAG TPA: HAD family hydrolase [bacterium]|nr:HAD family hydrolase [bacterium]
MFLDRDGTLIADAEYLSRPSQIKLFSNSPEALKRLREAGFYLFVVSNQSGVARGYFPESMVRKVHQKLQQMLKAKGARIDAFFYCPHYPDGSVKAFAKVCDCRKPAIGMVKQAARQYPIDLKRSYVVGDKMDDLLLARKAKLAGGLLVRTGNGRMSEKKLKATPLPRTSVVSDILGAARWILTKSSQ